MNILIASLNPIFPDKVLGGAQKQVRRIGLYLAELGHKVTILCTRRPDSMTPFSWHENLHVVPLFRFKQPFPEPYNTPIYNIAAVIQDMAEYLDNADVFYNHDGGVLFPYIWKNIPTVMSLRSILFSETLQSGYLLQGSALILNSKHTADTWIHTRGRFFPDLKARIHIILNGLDYDVYKPTPPTSILDVIDIDTAKYRYIIFPHRPEAAKGIMQTVKVVDKLVNHYGLNYVRVLVPKWIDVGLARHVREFYEELEATISERGLKDNFIFHNWISEAQMPEYYSIGSLMLAIGNYVETFGNTPYESLACGTPVIAARVAAYRDMLPDEIMVDYDDIEATATKAAGIIKNQKPVPETVLHWLKDNFKQDEMLQSYADLILNAKLVDDMQYKFTPITPETRFILAPWCYVSPKGIYHDFKGDYLLDEALITLLDESPDGFTFALKDEDTVMQWYRDGFVVPLQGQI